MADLFLIAHKVRGEPAFDIASQMQCPMCQGLGLRDCDEVMCDCGECDGLGYWWIIPTSGHRAFPWWNLALAITDLDEGMQLVMDHNPTKLTWTIFAMPPSLPDHYISRAAPKVSLIEALGLNQPTPSAPIRRRV